MKKNEPKLKLELILTEKLTIQAGIKNTSDEKISLFPQPLTLAIKNRWGKKIDWTGDLESVRSQTAPEPGPTLKDLITIEPHQSYVLTEVGFRPIEDKHELCWENRFIYRLKPGKYIFEASMAADGKYWDDDSKKYTTKTGVWTGEFSTKTKIRLPKM